MFPYKKQLSAIVALVLFAQQSLFAFPTAALQRDARRFKNLQTPQTEQQVQLSQSFVTGLEKFNDKTDSSYTVRINPQTGVARSLVEGDNLSVGKSEGSALSFLKTYKDLLGVDRDQLKIKISRRSPIGYHFYFEQFYKGLKVENAYVKVNTDTNGKLINYQSTFVKDLNIDITPAKTAQQAASAAQDDCAGSADGSAELVLYAATDGSVTLAWKLTVTGGAAEPGKWTYFVNATDGAIINRISLLMGAVETFSASLYPVYPGFGTTTKQTVPLENMDVYYFTGANTVSKAVTNTSGQVNITKTGRAFAALSGPYFTVTNQRQLSGVTGYYVEQGLDTATSTVTEPVSVDYSAWSTFTKPSGTPTPVYDACAAGSYPVFTAPNIEADFSVGKMDNYGDITSKVFMQVINPVDSRIVGSYIGQPQAAFYGPAIPTAYTGQTMMTALAPTTATGTYTISTLSKLCVPYTYTAGYQGITNHIITNQANNDLAANVFYNLNKTRDFFVALNAGNYIDLSTHLPVMVNAYGVPYSTSNSNGMINAFYDLDRKIILYGEGEYVAGEYKNFALENAVVRHEYVHAVVDKIWPILYFNEGAAISEGVSDYFALSSLTDGSSNPYTSKIGAWVNPNATTISGESVIRDLDSSNGLEAFDPVTWTANGIYGQHKNSLVLSQALWDLRAGTIGVRTDRIVWGALMFFPDSLLEFRDAMIASANALASTFGTNYSSAIATAFDNHNINYANIVTLNGDIYEPNNGPDTPTDINIAAIASKKINAKINPASDVDFYSVSLPAGRFEATLNLPQVANSWPTRYLAFGMFLLDTNLKTVVDIVSPELTAGQYNIVTASSSIKLTFDAPTRLSGNTGRYILGVFKMDQGYYPSTVTSDTGAYRLDFKFASGTNVGNLSTSVPAFSDGLTMTLTAPYSVSTATLNSSLASVVSSLASWAPNNLESLYSIRLLDEDLTPITNADTISGTYLTLVGSPSYDTGAKTITATVQFGNNFEALGYNTIYVQAFGKLRGEVSGVNSAYPTDYGIVSLGISNPIRNSVTSGKDIYIKDAVLNPTTGAKIKIEIAPPVAGKIKVQIFGIDGVLVKTLKDGDITTSLPDVLEWDGTNDSGNTVASGIYLLRVDGAGINKQLRKLVVVK